MHNIFDLSMNSVIVKKKLYYLNQKTMKSTISFLCRFPGVFIVSLLAGLYAIITNWHQLDARWGLPLVSAIVSTAIFNYYIFSGVTGLIRKLNSPGLWFSMIMILAITILMILANFQFPKEMKSLDPTDYAVQYASVQTVMLILVWAWFTLIWNMFFSSMMEPLNDSSKIKIKDVN